MEMMPNGRFKLCIECVKVLINGSERTRMWSGNLSACDRRTFLCLGVLRSGMITKTKGPDRNKPRLSRYEVASRAFVNDLGPRSEVSAEPPPSLLFSLDRVTSWDFLIS